MRPTAPCLHTLTECIIYIYMCVCFNNNVYIYIYIYVLYIHTFCLKSQHIFLACSQTGLNASWGRTGCSSDFGLPPMDESRTFTATWRCFSFGLLGPPCIQPSPLQCLPQRRLGLPWEPFETGHTAICILCGLAKRVALFSCPARFARIITAPAITT